MPRDKDRDNKEETEEDAADDAILEPKTKRRRKEKENTPDPDPIFAGVDEEATPLPPAAKQKRAQKQVTGPALATAPAPPSSALPTAPAPAPLRIGIQPTATSGKYKFLFSLAHPGIFRRLMETVMNLTTAFTLEIVGAKEVTDFQGVKLAGFVNNKTCHISGAVSAVVLDLIPTPPDPEDKSPPSPPLFSSLVTLNVTELGNIFKTIPPSHVTRIYQRVGDDRVHIEARDTLTKKMLHVSLPTLEMVRPEQGIIEEHRFAASMEIGLAELDRIAHYLVLLKAEHIKFTILKRKSDSRVMVLLSAKGESIEYSEFFPTTIGASGVIRVAQTVVAKFEGEDDDEDQDGDGGQDKKGGHNGNKDDQDDGMEGAATSGKYETVVADTFLLKAITLFMKNLEKNTVTIYFSPTEFACMQYLFPGNLSEKDSIKYMFSTSEEKVATQ